MISNSLLRTLRLTTCVAGLMALSCNISAHAQGYNSAAPSSNVKARLYQGHMALMQGKNQQAIAILSKIIQNPNVDKVTLAKAFLKRAVAYQRIGHLESAINNFDFAEAFRILPKSDVRDLLYNRAQVYNLAGQPEAALADEKTLQIIDRKTMRSATRQQAVTQQAKRSLTNKPRRVMASKQFIPAQPQRRLANSQDQAPTVTASIGAASKQNPLQVAHTAILYGKNNEAIKILSGVINNRKTLKIMRARALLKRGVAYRRLGKVAASLSDFTKAGKLNALPKAEQRDLLFNRAKAYHAMNKHRLALRDEQSLLKIDGLLPQPTQGAPLTTAAIAAKPAMKTMQTFAQNPAQTPLQQAHAAILYGQNKQAVKILSKIIDNDKTPKKTMAQALLKRGVAYRRIGKVAASILDFTNAASLKTLSKSEQRDLLFNRAKAYKAVKMDKLAAKDDQSLLKIDGLLPKIDQGAPLTTASLQKGKMVGKGKKKRFVRTYKAVAQPKTLVGHIKLLMKKSKN